MLNQDGPNFRYGTDAVRSYRKVRRPKYRPSLASELYRWRGGLICLAVAVLAFFLYVVPAVTNLRALSPAMEASK